MRFIAALLAGGLLAGHAAAADRGLDQARLQRLEKLIQADIDRGRIPGAVMLIARDGKVVMNKALGKRDAEKNLPMRADSIFRIYSMTKPIVSVAAMMLVEEGKLQLSDPVFTHIPELKDLKVGVEKGDGMDLVAAVRQPTVHDIFRHTSGFTYGVFGKNLVKEEYKKAGVDSWDQTNNEFIKRLASVPLMSQPGTQWEYSRSVDVLGVVIERVSGQTLDKFLEERIFKPLGMKDSGFWVPGEQQARIAEPLPVDPDTKQPQKLAEIRQAPKLLSGGGGGVSTAGDYLKFAQMMLNGGELNGKRILARKTVEYMTTDHTGGVRGPAYLPGAGYGFGLGVAVRLQDGLATTPGSVGDYNWGGLGGTYFWVDPKEKLIAIWMMQAPNQRGYYRGIYRDMVYAAMTK